MTESILDRRNNVGKGGIGIIRQNARGEVVQNEMHLLLN